MAARNRMLTGAFIAATLTGAALFLGGIKKISDLDREYPEAQACMPEHEKANAPCTPAAHIQSIEYSNREMALMIPAVAGMVGGILMGLLAKEGIKHELIERRARRRQPPGRGTGLN